MQGVHISWAELCSPTEAKHIDWVHLQKDTLAVAGLRKEVKYDLRCLENGITV